ncbi:MAG: hypothetical protein RLZZ522_1545 [Verrucomicrobiota bacterium]|jgi:hypothetical protein
MLRPFLFFRFRLLWSILVVALGTLASGFAHPSALGMGTLTLQQDGRYALELKFDVLSLALDVPSDGYYDPEMNALLDGPKETLVARLADGKTRFLAGFAVLADGQPCPVGTLVFPGMDDVQRHLDSGALFRLPVLLPLTLTGQLPPGTRTLAVRTPEKFEVISLSIVLPDQQVYSVLAAPGEPTDEVAVVVIPGGVPPAAGQLVPALPPVSPPSVVASCRDWGWRYLHLGFIHILPRGTDHILFVLGLFLLGSRLRPLLWQVTAFTVAHSITLALAMYGVIRLSPQIVEPLIALSIAFVALENVFTAKLHRWRLVVVFGFGLIHGMGFAGVLMGLGLPRAEFVTALVTFNIGVELGQLAVIVLALVAVGWWRERPWYRRAVVVPVSGVIAAIGIFWTIQRLLLYYSA